MEQCVLGIDVILQRRMDMLVRAMNRSDEVAGKATMDICRAMHGTYTTNGLLGNDGGVK